MFKLSLRELFLLTALAGVGCAWWIQNKEVQRLRDKNAAERMWTEIAEQHEQEAMRQMAGIAEAVEREGFTVFADVKHGPHGAQLVRLDEDKKSLEVVGQTP